MTSTIGGILLLSAAGSASAQGAPALSEGQADRSTPRRTLASFLWWLQEKPGLFHPELAAQSLDLSHLETSEEGPALAIRLKRWLDAKGIYINPKSLPDDRDYLDPKEGKPRYWISESAELREIYLAKSDGLWLFSAETVGAIDELYWKEFPWLVDFVFNHLPKRFLWEIPLLRVKVWQLAGFAFLLFVALVLGRLVRWVLDHPIRSLVARTETRWDDLIFDSVSKPLGWLVVAGFLASTFQLLLLVKINRAAEVFLGSFATFTIVWAAYRLAEGLSDELKRRAETTESRIDDHLVPLVRVGLRALVISLGALLVLQSFGVNVGALVAGLGIGGLAVALAAQSLLGDLFASVSIALDKPFSVGDFIVFGDFKGTVEHVGIKTTTVRSLTGEQLVVANADLVKNPLRNFKRMTERRAVFSFGVVYGTPVDKLEAIPQRVREIIESQPGTRFERAHFQKFGDSSLDFEVVYWVLSPDYLVYMDLQQRINLELFRGFQKEGIEFAYPTRMVIVEQAGSATGR